MLPTHHSIYHLIYYILFYKRKEISYKVELLQIPQKLYTRGQLFLYFYPSVSSKTLGTKTSVDIEKISEEIFPGL